VRGVADGTPTGEVHPWGGPVVPRQLPAAPALFTGRDADLARLTHLLDRKPSNTVAISAVGGAGGVGKTWLALHWAHRNIDRFPDGQLHVDLRGFSPDSEPMPTAAALRGFLCALGVEPTAIPLDEHAQAAQFRSLVAGKRILIVLDNAASTEQVAPLLPGSPTCTVLVTSRRRLTGLISAHGAQHLPLDVLPTPDARALLASRIGDQRLAAGPEATATLIAICGGFPLALSIVAGRAAAQHHTSLRDLVAELQDAGLDSLDDGDAAASMPLVLSWSYRSLTPRQAQLFGLLGIAPGSDIGLAAAASLAGLPTGHVRGLLRELEQASLLVQHKPERYLMHDLIRQSARDYVRRELTSADLTAAMSRVISFYVHTAHRARLLIEPNACHVDIDRAEPRCRPVNLLSQAHALEWFATEHHCLVAAQAAAALSSRESASWQLAWTMSAYHVLRGLLMEDHSVWAFAEQVAAGSPDPTVDALVQRCLGYACVRLGMFEMARAHLTQALTAAQDVGDLRSQAHVHRIVSVVHEHLGDPVSALNHATQALHLFQAVGDDIWEADTLGTLGCCTALLRRYDQAQRYCHAAFPLLREHYPPGIADVLDTLGYIAHHTDQHTDALDYLRRATALYRSLGDLYHLPDVLDRTGHVLVALNRTNEAQATWRQALTLYRSQHRLADARRVQWKIDKPELRIIASYWPYRRR
jgi:tetratricopeptide (TPR) repeat protein